jgi:hypothetical protein
MMTAKHWTFGLSEKLPLIAPMAIESKTLPSLCDIRAERIRAMRDRRSLLKIAANRQHFPLFSHGRMIVQHPNY